MIPRFCFTLYSKKYITKMSAAISSNALIRIIPRLKDEELFEIIDKMASELQDRAIISDESTTAPRTKASAKANEDRDVNKIIELLNDAASAKGEEMRHAFYVKFGKTVTGARRAEKSGGRKAHYDFQIQVDGGDWLKVEHKGSIKFAPINPDLPPWKEGVQFYNGGLEKYRFTQKYATAWYNKYIASGVLTERYELMSPIPTLEEWISNDAKKEGNPKTTFGKELKRVVRASVKGGSLKAERDELVEEFYAGCTDVDCAELAEDILPLVRECLAEKQVWLQIAGDIERGEFNFAWSPQFTVSEIKSVRILKASDIKIEVECNDGFNFGGILRWGNGMGFSNIRLDLK
jgi:hypothetical protein